MKALVCTEYGPPERLVVREQAAPVAGPRQVVVSVKAASVNFPDVLIIQGKYQFKPPPPFSPGSELAGVVHQIGPGVSGLAAGDRVLAHTTFGAFAEQVAVDAAQVFRIPDGMSFRTASALLLTYGTMDHALRDRGEVRRGETVLVLGAAGGVGLASIEVARALGARVIAAASTDDKLALCRTRGADEVVNYATEDFRARLKALTGGRGVDVVCDPVGGPFTEPALRSLAWRGRHLVIGFAAGEIPRIPLNLALLKGCSIVGVFWGEFLRREPAAFAASVGQLYAWHAAGAIDPLISATFPLARAADALALLAARRAVGKVVVEME